MELLLGILIGFVATMVALIAIALGYNKEQDEPEKKTRKNTKRRN